MIILKNIKINNFLSHKNTEIPFEEDVKIIIQGSSGTGKSSIIEAIIWALYGRGRVENRNIIRRGAKQTMVVLSVKDGKKEYRIERTVTLAGKSSLSILEKKKGVYTPVKVTGIKDSQNWIEKQLLKSSYTLFINSVAYPQDNTESFVKQTAIKRKELLLEITDTENYDALYNKAKEEITTLENSNNNNSFNLASIKEEVAAKELIVELLPELEEKQKESSLKIENLKKEIAEIKKEEKRYIDNQVKIRELHSDVNTVNNKFLNNEKIIKDRYLKIQDIAEINPDIAKAGKKDLEETKYKLKILEDKKKEDYENSLRRQSIMNSKPFLNDYDKDLQKLDSDLLDLYSSKEYFCEEIGRNCPKLEKKFNDNVEYINNQIKNVKERKADQEAREFEYEISISSIPAPSFSDEEQLEYERLAENLKRLSVYENQELLEEREKTLKMFKDEMTSLSEENKALTLEMEMIESDILELKKVSPVNKTFEIEKMDQEIDGEKSDYFSLSEKIKQIKETKESIKKLNVEKEELLKKEAIFFGKKESLELAKEAFGNKGIKVIIIDYLLPRLEYRINEILSKMSDFKIRLETQKNKNDGEGSTEGLFINIYNEAGEWFPLANYSGGQKMKISIAIAEALATLQKCSFRIFDEPFTALDESSLEDFNEVIHSLQDKFSQMLCISHLRTIQDSFEKKMEVVKEGDTSRIII